MEETPNVWNTPMNELTFKQSLKIQGVVLGATAGLFALWIGGVTLVDKIQTRRLNREYKQLQEQES